MKDSPLHVALRQWRAQFSNPVPLLILAAVAALLAIVGPFETGIHLPPVPRFAYWLVMAGVTYSLGLLSNIYLLRALPEALATSLRVAIAGIVAGLAITPVVVGLNFLTFDTLPAGGEWPGLLARFFAISVIISVIFHAVSAVQPDQPPPPQPHTPQPPLLDRLPLHKRGALVALSSEDHYTRIRTTRGAQLVLIRLSDAIREAEPAPGLRVHRSHWVALDQVTAARRDGDRAILTVTGGGDIPVSRANIPAIKDAGLLPR